MLRSLYRFTQASSFKPYLTFHFISRSSSLILSLSHTATRMPQGWDQCVVLVFGLDLIWSAWVSVVWVWFVICGCGFVLWCSVGCFMVVVGLLVVVVLCWCWIVFFFFWFSYWGLWLWLVGWWWRWWK